MSQLWFSQCWSNFASGGGSVQWRVSESQVFFKFNFTGGSRAVWKFNPSRFIVFRSVQLNKIFISSFWSGISFVRVVSVINWVGSLARWVKLTLFLLSNLMFSFWNNNISVDNWIINLKISFSWVISSSWSWGSINSFPAFAVSNDGVWKIIFQGNHRKGKILRACAIW